MKSVIFTILCFLLLLQVPDLYGQQKPAEADLEIKDLKHEVFNGCLDIDFALPDQGVIEFVLLSDSGSKIWFTQYLKDSGDNKIRVNLKPLTEGNLYEFNMVFKGNKYKGEFEADHTKQVIEEEYEEYEEYDDYDYDDDGSEEYEDYDDEYEEYGEEEDDG